MILGDMFSGGSDVPEKYLVPLAPEAEQIIDSSYDKAMEPIDREYGRIDQISSANQPLQGDINQAIKNKYQGILGQKLESYKSGERISARNKKLQSLKVAQRSLLVRSQIQNDIFMKNFQTQILQEQARAETLRSILTLGGSAAGYGMAGGFSSPDAQGGKLKGGQYTADVSFMSAMDPDIQQGTKRTFTTEGAEGGSKYRESLKGIGDFGSYTS
jgi:hypothetical protein